MQKLRIGPRGGRKRSQRDLERGFEPLRGRRSDRLRSEGGERVTDEFNGFPNNIGEPRGEAGTLERFDGSSQSFSVLDRDFGGFLYRQD
jgi:hypothetical protein